jgi:hypothetical protein
MPPSRPIRSAVEVRPAGLDRPSSGPPCRPIRSSTQTIDPHGGLDEERPDGVRRPEAGRRAEAFEVMDIRGPMSYKLYKLEVDPEGRKP